MSRESFKPLGFANYLVDTGDYRKADKQFLHWGGTHWEEIDEHDMQSLALDWIEEFGGHGNASCNNAKQACATAMLRLSKLTEPSKETIVPVLNGYVHLDATGVKLLPHDKELGLRHVIKCNFDPTAPTSVVFERFIEWILPDAAVRQRVQEYIGYTLQPDARHQIAQFWLGSGANGKGVLANIVQALHHRVAAVNLDQLNNFNMTETVNASLIYCDEAPQGRISDSTFKMVTAGEKVAINRKYRDPISTRILGKWLILGNHVPTITDHSEGFWRRLNIIPFDVTIPVAERDPLLANHIIEHELSGVLNWALEGAVRLLARGGL